MDVDISRLDGRLIRAMREGASALPGDLSALCGYLQMIDVLLHEKASELEPSWEDACASAAELATLHTLAESVAERAADVRAEDLPAVRLKLAIWRMLGAGEDASDLRDLSARLVRSVEADLERLTQGPRRR